MIKKLSFGLTLFLLTITVFAQGQKKNKVSKFPKFDGYLFAYFEGSGPGELQEQLRFATSVDAIHWKALNNNQPVIPSAQISATGGIRDPHILRGQNDESFYLVATDMFTVKNGWGHNPGIVMLRSDNLIDWSHGVVDLHKSYPQQFPDVQWVWAPQTIYDPVAKKYLVYFTVKLKNSPALDFYCAYANKDLNGFENVPKLMFKAKYGAIDGDIILKDGIYHFFYKGNTKDADGKEIANGIQQATSKSLRGPWVEDFKYIDAYSAKHIVVEGSGVFKLNDEDSYILMYDLYANQRYEFQSSRDLFNFTQTPESFTKDFNPRHGTVMSIAKQEAQLLNKKWGGVQSELLKNN
ncbi:glycoside hydrolase family 43 protein [Mucilaginibacter sp. 21P]|uniref:glycoside hydrolase family 43 protein n=1 Tax=Mucilaginibacter sp. 21P TaxID=2778902 RepID=UPI001C55CA33|nr:glycoside hydrolase family 43 protein [Mucilaginibacter sp. 21P]QXV64256.1 glycoside hydrolase family 43 protein [Mucilaginibacter sp. 21P]